MRILELKNLSKVTTLVYGRSGIQIQVCLTPDSTFLKITSTFCFFNGWISCMPHLPVKMACPAREWVH